MKLFLFYPNTASIQPIIQALETRGVAVISAERVEDAWKLMQTHARSLDLAIISREGPAGSAEEAGFDLIAKSKKISKLEDLPWVCITNKWNQKQCAKHQNTPMGANAYWVGAMNEKTVISTVEAIMGTKLSIQSGDPAGSDFVLEESPFAQDGPTTAEMTSGSFAIKLELPNIDFDAEASVPPPGEAAQTSAMAAPPAPPEEPVFRPSEPVELSQIIEPLEISPRGHDMIPTAEPVAVAPPAPAPPPALPTTPAVAAAAPAPVGPPKFSVPPKPPAIPTAQPASTEAVEVSGFSSFEAHAGVTAPSLTLTSVHTLPELEKPDLPPDDPSLVIETPTELEAQPDSLSVQNEASVFEVGNDATIAIQKMIQGSSASEEPTASIVAPNEMTMEIPSESLSTEEPVASFEMQDASEEVVAEASAAESNEEFEEENVLLAEISEPEAELNWSPEPPTTPEIVAEAPEENTIEEPEALAQEVSPVSASAEKKSTFDVTSLQPVEMTRNLADSRAQDEVMNIAAAPIVDEATIPVIEAAVSEASVESNETVSEPDLSEELAQGGMSYLFSKSPKGPQTPAAQIASISAETAFAQPVGDAVVPGGAVQPPDLETLKKYLLLREQDVGVLSSQLRAAKQQIQNLEQQVKLEHAKNAEITHLAESQDKKIKEFESKKEEELSALRSEISDLKLQIRTRTDKMRLIETQMLESAEEVERIRERVKADIRKIRTREKELENRLEIMKKDSEALIVARENKIVELKRKLDLLEFNMDIMQDQYAKEKEKCAVLKERLAKAAQIVRAAGGLLDHSEMKAQAASISPADESKLKAS